MADDKAIRRIENLLRLAAPSSNSTIHERLSAATEAARLSIEHGVALGVVKDVEKEAAPSTVRKGVWVQSIALQWCSCSYCHERISSGDHVWVRIVNDKAQFRHNYAPCKIA